MDGGTVALALGAALVGVFIGVGLVIRVLDRERATTRPRRDDARSRELEAAMAAVLSMVDEFLQRKPNTPAARRKRPK